MRLIDADILLKRIEQSKLSNPHTDIAFKRAHEAEHCHFLHMVIDMPTVEPKQGKWIPCSERLPKEHEWIGTKLSGTTISDEVMITFESNGERFVKIMSFQNGELGRANVHAMDVLYGEWKMLAWMSLPKPWKGSDDEASD